MKWLLVFFLTLPVAAHAHVQYVVSPGLFDASAGRDDLFLLHAFSDRQAWILLIVSLIVLVIVYKIGSCSRLVRDEHEHILESRRQYEAYFPWMMRLALGISLIGAGSAQALLTPGMEALPWIASIEFLLGFLILVGFLLTPAVLLTILLFFFALGSDLYTLGSFEFLALALSLFIYADSRPGLDHLLELPFLSPLTHLRHLVPLILRLGIGISMVTLAISEKFLNPHASVLVVEQFDLTHFIPVSPEAWVLWVGVVELVIGLLLLLGIKTRLVSLIAFVVLSLSFFFFGEEVYAHITLFTVLSILFVTGSGTRIQGKQKIST
jgi:uncharacterized membrane protein YphA (DoxX/SURF4 family)